MRTAGVRESARQFFAIGFGPQYEIFAHQTNEEVSLDALVKAAVFYAAIPQIILDEVRK
jgi:acetylornithine deacetylase/succinyl-diaminopimelate desuccinylase-like protein